MAGDRCSNLLRGLALADDGRAWAFNCLFHATARGWADMPGAVGVRFLAATRGTSRFRHFYRLELPPPNVYCVGGHYALLYWYAAFCRAWRLLRHLYALLFILR